MKKTAFRQPTARTLTTEADSWVAAAPDAVPPAVPAPVTVAASGGKPARLTIDLPPDLHADFKAACARRRTRMVDEVRRFIEDWTQKNS